MARRESLFFVAGLKLLRTLRSALRRALPSKREQVRPEGRASGRGSPPGRERVKWRAATLTLALIAASIGYGYFILPTAEAAIAFDAASSATGSGATLTWSHTVGAGGTERILVVGVSLEPRVTTQTTYATATDTTFTVPAGVTSIDVKAWGAGGGGAGNEAATGGDGGGGGYAFATISVSPGESLGIEIGGGGAGGTVSGSGNGGAGGGGGLPVAGGGAGAGASSAVGGGGGGAGYAAVKRGATLLVIGAGGGGGGGGGNSGPDDGTDGGAGGGATGDAGASGGGCGGPGGGGTQSAGGAGGSGGGCTGSAGTAGSLNQGGNGGNNGGGGGGSGYYGGGGGQGDDDGGAGGGGGSSFGDILISGSGTTAGNTSDPDYGGSAGQGGAGATTSNGNGGGGNPGRIVLTYELPVTVTDVTYGGVSLTELVNHSEAGDTAHVELWYMIAPATGTADIVITQDTANAVVGGATSWTGVGQTTPFGPTAVANGTTDTATVDVTSASNDVVVDVVSALNTASLSVGAGQTQRWNLAVGDIDGGGSSETGAATVTMNWTLSGASGWAIAGVSLRAGACDALTVATSDPAGQLWFNETVEPDGPPPFTTQLNVSASFQTGATPALSVTNDGGIACDVTIRTMSDPGTGRSLKFNTTNNAPWPADASREVPLDPSSVTVCSAVAPGGTCDIWLWADYENALGGQTLADVRVETT